MNYILLLSLDLLFFRIMKYSLASVFFTFFCIAFLAAASGQTNYSFNFNINSGLPANHVYGLITDKHGYLWIATEKGIVKYNGYEFKTFNLSNGLPNDDIWELTEDKKGRIWLGNISDEYGYIYNDIYHKAIVKGSHITIYPVGVRAFGNGII